MGKRKIRNPGTIERAIEAVAVAYKGLRRANGYKHTVVEVRRHLVDVDALDKIETPAVFVIRPEGTSGVIEWQDERGYKESIRIDVLGFIRGGGENPENERLASFAEGLLSDLKKLQMADPQFGTAATGEIKNSKIVADSNDAGWDSSGAVVGIGVEMIVLFDGTNP